MQYLIHTEPEGCIYDYPQQTNGSAFVLVFTNILYILSLLCDSDASLPVNNRFDVNIYSVTFCEGQKE